jgi:hypothetical protein
MYLYCNLFIFGIFMGHALFGFEWHKALLWAVLVGNNCLRKHNGTEDNKLYVRWMILEMRREGSHGQHWMKWSETLE